MSSCGVATYSLLCNLVAPAKPSDKSYHDLNAVMNERQNWNLAVIMERYKLNITDRQLSESIPFYVTELKHLSEHCDFGLSLDNMIRDRLVCRARNTKIQQLFFAET